MKIKIPEKADFILNRLKQNGFTAYAVGGCVRDSVMGRIPHDWDICTSAKPQETKRVFFDCKMFDNGIKHGTISVVVDGEVFEITTYRIDGQYSDNRRPESVVFTDDVKEDLRRRDFTVNAMAYSEETGLIDPFGGRDDIMSGVIRCVGNPDKRFNEDALRILRALRFASVYGLKIEEETAESILENRFLLENIANERIQTELNKLLCGDKAEDILNDFREVFAVFIPQIKCTFAFNQKNPHHNRLLWEHTTASVGFVEKNPILRMTMLLHDLGKPESCIEDENGVRHFHGHPEISAEIARKILKNLKYSSDFTDRCVKLVLYHDVRFNGNKRHIKRVMKKIGAENVEMLFKVQMADLSAQSDCKYDEKFEDLKKSQAAFNEILSEESCFSLKQLEINGRDLISIGIDEGQTIGKILNILLENVIDDKIKNEKNELLAAAKEILSEVTSVIND